VPQATAGAAAAEPLHNPLARAPPSDFRSATLRSLAEANPSLDVLGRLANPIEKEVEQTEAATRRTRNAQEALRTSGLALRLKPMSLAEHAAAVRAAAANRALSDKCISALSQYTIFMRSKNLPPILPISGDAAAAYASWKAWSKGNYTHTVGAHVSALRVAARTLGAWGLTEGDEAVLTQVQDMIKKTAPTAPKEVRTVPWQVLLQAAEQLEGQASEGSTQALQTWTMLALSVGFLMRGTELAGELGVRWSDLVPTDSGLALLTCLSKTTKATTRPNPRVALHLPPDIKALCATRALSAYRAAASHAGLQTDGPNPVFTAIAAHGALTDHPLDSATAQRHLSTALVAAGMDRSAANDHFGRYAGNDLYVYRCGIDPVKVGLLADWAVKDSKPDTTQFRTYMKHVRLDSLIELARSATQSAYTIHCCTSGVDRPAKRSRLG
jgi:hypothetical protein